MIVAGLDVQVVTVIRFVDALAAHLCVQKQD
jgi:hypothetical protein